MNRIFLLLLTASLHSCGRSEGNTMPDAVISPPTVSGVATTSIQATNNGFSCAQRNNNICTVVTVAFEIRATNTGSGTARNPKIVITSTPAHFNHAIPFSVQATDSNFYWAPGSTFMAGHAVVRSSSATEGATYQFHFSAVDDTGRIIGSTSL